LNHSLRTSSKAWLAATLVAAFAAGVFLRVHQVPIQIPLDDEWHAIAKASESSYRQIVLSFGLADHSIPLSLAVRWLIGAGRLSEAWLFAPPIAAGVLACVLLVVSVRKVIPPVALATYSGLLAISPLLVLYARQARPYAFTLLLCLVAAWAAYRWWRDGKALYAAVYLVAAPLAVWMHLIVAPFALGVWVVFLAEWLLDPRRDRQRLVALLAVGALAAAITAALVVPPLVADWGNLKAKAAADFPNLHSLERMAALMAGTASSLPALGLALLAAPGIVLLHRARPGPTRFVLALLALQVAAVLASHAYLLHYGLVLARYLLILLPFFLLAAAVGLAWLVEPLARFGRWIPWTCAAGVVAGLVALGPLPAALYRPNSFFQHHIYFFDFEEAENLVAAALKPGPMPEFYRRLGAEPAGSRVLIEAPWRHESIFNRLPYFQQVHGQRVKIGMVGKLCPPGAYAEYPRLYRNKFRNLVDLSKPIEALRREGDFVVFHRTLQLPNLTKPWQYEGGLSLPPVDACIVRFSSMFGPPVFEDATITVFALGKR
jgi:hypothetical protein